MAREEQWIRTNVRKNKRRENRTTRTGNVYDEENGTSKVVSK